MQDSKKEELLKRNLLKRAGTAEEVANAAAFLVSDLTSYITG
ncbi:MAG: SDR family oxidoreductase [Succinivibrio sp.]